MQTIELITESQFKHFKEVLTAKTFTVSVDTNLDFNQIGYDFYDDEELAIYGDLNITVTGEESLNVRVGDLDFTCDDGMIELELSNNQYREILEILENQFKYEIN